jgi:hypothetical protein
MIGDLDWQQFLETEATVHCVPIGEHRLRVIEAGAGVRFLQGGST